MIEMPRKPYQRSACREQHGARCRALGSDKPKPELEYERDDVC